MHAKVNGLGIAALVLGAIVAIGVLTFAGPCVHDDGTTSTCATAGTAVLWGGVVLAVCALVAALAKNKAVRIAFYAICVAVSAFIILAPGTIFPLCMMAAMHCQAVMRPFAQVVGGIAAVVSVVGLIVAARAK